MLKTVLLLTYYFEPCNYVAANRPSTLAKEFIRNGYRVIVVTRHWNGNEKYWADYLASSTTGIQVEKRAELIIHKLPYHARPLPQNYFLRKIRLLSNFVSGKFHDELNYTQFRPYVESVIETNDIDLILVSSPPLNLIKLAYQLKEKYNLKYMVDIRDFQNNVVLNKSSEISFRNKFVHFFIMLHVRKWFRQAELIFTVTPPFTRFIQEQANRSTITVMNGYSEKLLSINEKPFERFHISYIGTLYHNAELEILLNGLKALYQQEFSHQIIFNFVGTKANPDVAEKLMQVIPAANLILQDRIPQELAQKQAAQSQVLLVLGYKSMKGVFGTKIFEYMGLRKPVLLFPSDEGPMQEMITQDPFGVFCQNENEFVNAVRNYFTEWKETGQIKFNGNIEFIKQYSRENQYQKLLPYLKQI